MAHEIQEHDNVVLHREKAWHGLGIVVQDAPTPLEALKIAGLDWTVDQWSVVAKKGNEELSLDKYRLNVRMDKKIPLGMVGNNYQPIQNSDLAEFCEALAKNGDSVKVESAGSIRNGQKVWFLLKGESFSVRRKDEVSPYICVSNGFDGNTSMRCDMTSVRVVCSNTLHLVIPQKEGRKQSVKPAAYTVWHLGNIKSKVDDARNALGLYQDSLVKTREIIDAVAAKQMNSKAVERFLLECYTKHFGAIADSPTTAKEQKARDAATEAIASMIRRFESEKSVGGTTAWNAVNAYTGWLQHDRKTPGKDSVVKQERRAHAVLLGNDSERTHEAFALALTI